jgi:hypothetical protein
VTTDDTFPEEVGQIQRFEYTEWPRGPARFANGYVEMDRDRAELYVLIPSIDTPTLPFDLANISSDSDAVAFTERYGLLRHGPGAPTSREKLSDFIAAAERMSKLVRLYWLVGESVAGDSEAFALLRKAVGPAIADDELCAQTSMYSARLLSEGLRGAHIGVADAHEFSEATTPGSLVWLVNVRNLEQFAYYQFANLATTRTPIRPCAECGKMFVVEDARRRFCSTRCASRQRQRRGRGSLIEDES